MKSKSTRSGQWKTPTRLVALVVGGILSATLALGGDGTLPVRLPGDGTLPTLAGQAIEMTNTHDVRSTQIKFTALHTEPLAAGTGGFSCRGSGPSMSKHYARGGLVVGGTSFAIAGVCYNDQSDELEVVATSNNGAASVFGSLPPDTELKRLVGRMLLQAGSAGRFSVDLKDSSN